MGPRCTSKFCERSKVRACSEINEEDRKNLFDNFWKTMSWDQRKIYVVSLVDILQTKRKRTTAESSRRSDTLMYNLVIKGKK